MKATLVGVGQAGGKLTQTVVERADGFEADAVSGALAVNTAEADLSALDVDTLLVGRDRVNGQGVGGDNELGAEVMDGDAREVMDAIDGRVGTDAEAILLLAGLGGGTGSGGAPVLARELQRVYDVPVYAVGIVPGTDEGAIYQANAGRSLKTLAREADGVLLVHNDALRSSGESLREGFDAVNRAIAQRVALLLASGEAVEGVAESVVDTSEVVNTLAGGSMAAVGFASAAASEDPAENVTVVTSLARRAVMNGMSFPGATTASAGLLVVAGQPDRIPRKGVERARKWLEEETGSRQVRGGDVPLESERLAALVVLSGVERADRLATFVERAREAASASEREQPELFQNEDLDGLL